VIFSEDFVSNRSGDNVGRRRRFIHHRAHETWLLIDVDLRLATYHIPMFRYFLLRILQNGFDHCQWNAAARDFLSDMVGQIVIHSVPQPFFTSNVTCHA